MCGNNLPQMMKSPGELARLPNTSAAQPDVPYQVVKQRHGRRACRSPRG
jgi:hypothetical protein